MASSSNTPSHVTSTPYLPIVLPPGLRPTGASLRAAPPAAPLGPDPPLWLLQAKAFLQSAGNKEADRSELKWKCDICGVKTRNEADWEAHTASKEHLKRVREKEQRAVLILGLPEEVGVDSVCAAFRAFNVQPAHVSFVPAGDPATCCPEGELEDGPQPPPEAFWHVELGSVDAARRAVKCPNATIAGYEVTLALAIHPFRCAICNISLNSDKQLQQHFHGSKHKEQLKLHVAQCSLMLAGVPAQATVEHVHQFLAQFSVSPGSVLLISGGGVAPPQSAHVTFNSSEDANRIFQLRDAETCILGTRVRIERRYEAPPKEIPELSLAGEKTPEEALMLARAFLHARKVRDARAISASAFSRAFTFYLASKPMALPGVLPKDRFFDEFDSQAGGKQGTISFEHAMAIIQPIERDFSFTLPDGVNTWLSEKLSKYHSTGKESISKGTFVQIRNLKCHVYQATQEITKGLLLNQVEPPLQLEFPYQRRMPGRFAPPGDEKQAAAAPTSARHGKGPSPKRPPL